MDTDIHRCKGCGIVFPDLDKEIDKCAKKRLYCELCLAEKNPWSATEQKIKKKYIRGTALIAFLVMVLLFVLNWDQNKNDNFLEYIVGFGFGYALIWGFIALLFIPVLMLMKKPYKGQINQEKERYREEIGVQKKSRNIVQEGSGHEKKTC